MSRLRAYAVPSRARGQSSCLPQLRPSSAHWRRRTPADLFDDGAATRIELPKTVADPLRFRDRRRYTDRLKEAQTVYGRRQRRGGRRPRADRRPARGGRRVRFRLHGRLDGAGRGRSTARRGQARRVAGGGADRRPRLGRRAHAGRRLIVDADAAHDHRRRHGQGGGAPLHRAADRPDDRRRIGIVCDGRRHHLGRARRRHRLCRRAGHRGDDPRKAARRVSARRISARPRHDRHGGATRGTARDDRAAARPAARAATAECSRAPTPDAA